jgi:hypothetical protein
VDLTAPSTAELIVHTRRASRRRDGFAPVGGILIDDLDAMD